jgi:hypothetical protein
MTTDSPRMTGFGSFCGLGLGVGSVLGKSEQAVRANAKRDKMQINAIFLIFIFRTPFI